MHALLNAISALSSAVVGLQSSTMAAGLAVGNTISTLAPQLAGAIDIVIVEQPDGSLKSSPFYGALTAMMCYAVF